MNAITMLFTEHRLIQKTVSLLNKFSQKDLNPDLIDNFVDFFRTYADKRHHGKEEAIFFKALETKPLSPELKKTMAELVEEHKKARKLISALGDLKSGPRQEVQSCLQKIVRLYTSHIDKENHHFFMPAFNLFNEEEKNNLLKSFQEFDKTLVPKDYEQVLKEIEKLFHS